jgi:hypothetical protein
LLGAVFIFKIDFTEIRRSLAEHELQFLGCCDYILQAGRVGQLLLFLPFARQRLAGLVMLVYLIFACGKLHLEGIFSLLYNLFRLDAGNALHACPFVGRANSDLQFLLL